MRSNDILFGTAFMFTRKDNFYENSGKTLVNSRYDASRKFNGLYNISIRQAPTTIQSIVTPSNFFEVLSIMGGFATLLTKCIAWTLAGYQSFTFKKSSIKKLYYYSRTKKKADTEDQGSDSDPEDNSSPIKIESKDLEKKLIKDEEKKEVIMETHAAE